MIGRSYWNHSGRLLLGKSPSARAPGSEQLALAMWSFRFLDVAVLFGLTYWTLAILRPAPRRRFWRHTSTASLNSTAWSSAPSPRFTNIRLLQSWSEKRIGSLSYSTVGWKVWRNATHSLLSMWSISPVLHFKSRSNLPSRLTSSLAITALPWRTSFSWHLERRLLRFCLDISTSMASALQLRCVELIISRADACIKRSMRMLWMAHRSRKTGHLPRPKDLIIGRMRSGHIWRMRIFWAWSMLRSGVRWTNLEAATRKNTRFGYHCMSNQCSYSCNTLGLVKQYIYLFICFESRAPKVVAELGKGGWITWYESWNVALPFIHYMRLYRASSFITQYLLLCNAILLALSMHEMSRSWSLTLFYSRQSSTPNADWL